MNCSASILALSALTLISCSNEPKLDGSSDDALRESAEAARQTLEEPERSQFDAALSRLLVSGVSGADDFANTRQLLQRHRERIHGKTAQEVIKEAKLLKDGEVKALRAKLALARKARSEIARFVVERSRILSQATEQPRGRVIELTVRNGTTRTVSCAHFLGVAITPGRSNPCVLDKFSYQIPGGLAPGMTATWRLDAVTGDKADAPDYNAATVFAAVAVRLDGPDGETVFGDFFDEQDELRLRALNPPRAALEALSQWSLELDTTYQIALARAARIEIAELEEKKRAAESSQRQLYGADNKALVERVTFTQNDRKRLAILRKFLGDINR